MCRRYRFLTALSVAALGIFAEGAVAHDLKLAHTVLPDHRILVYCWYNGLPRSTDAKGADVEVKRPGRESIKGVTDDRGEFTFTYDRAEEMTIIVSQAGHVNHPPDVVRVEELEDVDKSGSDGASSLESGHDTSSASNADHETADAAAGLHKAAEQSSVQLLKDLLLGVCVIFSIAAFVLSLRNARQLRDIRKLLEDRQTVGSR